MRRYFETKCRPDGGETIRRYFGHFSMGGATGGCGGYCPLTFGTRGTGGYNENDLPGD